MGKINMNKITLDLIDEKEMYVCDCGAKAGLKDRNRFLRRHPRLCSERAAFTKQVAQGTRCVEDEETEAGKPGGRVGIV